MCDSLLLRAAMRAVGWIQLPPGFQRQGQMGAGVAGYMCISATRQLKLGVYRYLCVKIHFSLLYLSDKTGRNWNVKTSFQLFSFSPNPFL